MGGDPEETGGGKEEDRSTKAKDERGRGETKGRVFEKDVYKKVFWFWRVLVGLFVFYRFLGLPLFWDCLFFLSFGSAFLGSRHSCWKIL